MAHHGAAAVRLALVAVIVGAGLVAWISRYQSAAPKLWAAGQVVQVVDGDTIKVQGVGSVRLLLVDAPETHDNSHGPKGCYGETAKKFMAGILPPGTQVELFTDRQKRDKYGRLLAYMESDGVDVGEELLRRGYAEILTYKPNTARLARYTPVQNLAEQQRLGIWSSTCAP